MPGTAPPYPPSWEADVVVADGGTVHIRPITPEDADALVAFHASLSPRTRYLRYFSAYPTIPDRDLYRFTNVDYHDRVALIAVLGADMIAVGLYEGSPGSDEAEVAFVVADAHQGRGIGSILLEHLAAAARESGIKRFSAVVLAENSAMIRVFLDAGYQISRSLAAGEVNLEFDIDETAMTEAVMREREQHAEARSIRRLLFPSAVAVVGASNVAGKIGNAVFRNLLRMGFEGPLFPVNAEARHVNGVRAYPSVLDVPDHIDLAVVTVPAASVAAVVEQCASRGVHGLVVMSGGFGERGDEAGREAQRSLVQSARENGMRVVGPNCLGIVNTDPSIRLNASLAPVAPLRGRAGFFCQSGALGVAILGEAARRGLGVSTFVSAGNRADVSGNDLLQYWESDDSTDLALLYLESFGNPRKFARLTRRLGRKKPIIAVKTGHGLPVAGLRHTSVDVPDETVQALFESSGVIRVDTLQGLFDVALLLTSQPLPAGDRVAVVGNSTALGVLVANACHTERLTMVRLVDVGVDSTPAEFGAAVRTAAADEDVDSLVVVFVPPLIETSGEDFAAELGDAVADSGKPVVSTFLGFEGVPSALARAGEFAPMPGSIPSYSSPERAVRALARATRHSRWRQRPVGTLPDYSDIDRDSAAELMSTALTDAPDGRLLGADETGRLLGCYGIAVVAARAVHGLTEAQRVAAELSGPVAIKVPGAVRLHLNDPNDVATAWRSLHLGDESHAMIQPMVPRGIDTVVEARDDRSFGALVSFGVGGVATDLLGDRSYAVVPLTTADADRLIHGPKAFPLLQGYSDTEPADLAALADLALRLSTLADELPQVQRCVISVVAAPDTASVIAAEIEVGRTFGRPDTGPRRLRGL